MYIMYKMYMTCTMVFYQQCDLQASTDFVTDTVYKCLIRVRDLTGLSCAVYCVNCITSNLFKTCLKPSFWPDFEEVCTDFLLSKAGLFRSCMCGVMHVNFGKYVTVLSKWYTIEKQLQ